VEKFGANSRLISWLISSISSGESLIWGLYLECENVITSLKPFLLLT